MKAYQVSGWLATMITLAAGIYTITSGKYWPLWAVVIGWPLGYLGGSYTAAIKKTN